MPDATQTWVAESGADWGLIIDASTRETAAIGSGPQGVNAGGEVRRGFFELRMADLVADGYTAGTELSAAALTCTIDSTTTDSIRLVVHNSAALADDDATLFGRIGPSNTAWSDDVLVDDSGELVINLNAAGLAAIAGLGASDTRVIGFCLADESGSKEVYVAATANATLTITYTEGGGGVEILSGMTLLGC